MIDVCGMTQKKTRMYNRLVREIDSLLQNKRISYAHFARELGISSVQFYNRYRNHGFELDMMYMYLDTARKLPANTIRCLKCGCEFMPKAKGVKKSYCDTCRDVLKAKEAPHSDKLKFRYPDWVIRIGCDDIRNIVEQEFHICEETARMMASVKTVDDAKRIRAEKWSYAGATSACSIVEVTSIMR